VAKIKFTLGANTFTFEADRAYPMDDPEEVLVPTAQSEGGQLYAYDKGITVQWFNLVFSRATKNDHDNAKWWCKTIACGPKNTFTYTDEDENDHTVRMINTKSPLKKMDSNKYAGTIVLRKEIV